MTGSARENEPLKGLSVAHVSSAHPWTDNRIHFREAASIQAAGAEVILIAVESALAATRKVPVVALPRRSRWSRMAFGTFAAARRGLASKARLVHLHDPEMIPFIPLLRLFGKIVVYDAHEDLPEQVANKTYLPRPLRIPAEAASRALLALARRANLIVVATETIAQRFPGHKTVLVRNYPPLRAAESEAPDPDQRSPSAIYIGGLSHERGALTMLDAAGSDAFPPGWQLKLAGKASASVLSDLTSHLAWPSVKFLGEVPPERARDLLLEARVGLSILRDTPAYRDSLPTKMFEYFAAGIPVVASDFPLWREIVDRWECGILVDPADPSAIAEAIGRYASDHALLALHSANARRAALEELNWAGEAARLVGAYEKLFLAD